ncbi:uncharacterized protein ARB_01023 [Trichophyton benhamiae CBS 112371]|uniref:Uncharacterized protein n=1 Tax=Arthroderma benhamiae (strain ATCC MYA-4681 / CBS 112371) TaxID=663331 RepID=D4AXV4_ARTBC|nr:uncharacterized protein ARB_01023 [Trichophyton benhamiae CBS 112371]EFE32132.1 conserved hypothetical protein [Trichophyton benhamiae CBS 112371]
MGKPNTLASDIGYAAVHLNFFSQTMSNFYQDTTGLGLILTLKMNFQRYATPDMRKKGDSVEYWGYPEQFTKLSTWVAIGLRSASSKRSSREAGEYDLAPASAAASYVTRGGYAKPGVTKRPDASFFDKHEEEPPSSIGLKAAYRSFRDSGVSGLGDVNIKDEGPEARMAATGAMSSSRKQVESMASPPDGVSDLTEALSAATISHRASRHGRPTAEKKVEFQLSPKRPYNPAITNARREMYTSHPPVSTTIEESRKRDTLQAAAVSMAKQMYAIIPKEDLTKDMETSSFTMEEPEERVSRHQRPSSGRYQRPPEASTMYESNRPRSQQYFTATKVRPSSEGFTDRGKYGDGSIKRARTQSRRDRNEVYYDDETMDAAQRNVKRMIDNIDNHIYSYHKRPSPAIMREWERHANELVLANRESTAFVDVGPEQMRAGAPLLPPRNVDDMARARVRPALHNIDDEVAERNSRRITDKLDEERYHRFISTQMERDKEVRRLNKKIIDLMHHPEKERRWMQKKRSYDRYESDEEPVSTWPYPPKRVRSEEGKGETILQALQEGGRIPDRPPRPYSSPEMVEKPSEPVTLPTEAAEAAETTEAPEAPKVADGTELTQEAPTAEEATNEETALTEQAGSQAKHIRRQKAIHKTWFTKPQEDAAGDEPPREVERIEERIVTEIEKERPATPDQSMAPMASGAIIPDSPHHAPSSHWSSSNEGSSHGSPGGQRQEDGTRPKKRMAFPHLFQRPARRTGNQGSFTVNRRSVPEDLGSQTSPTPGEAGSGSLATAGSRLSRFQENL